jgi:hypothetical protein
LGTWSSAAPFVLPFDIFRYVRCPVSFRLVGIEERTPDGSFHFNRCKNITQVLNANSLVENESIVNPASGLPDNRFVHDERRARTGQ